jgi:hypothetical protein
MVVCRFEVNESDPKPLVATTQHCWCCTRWRKTNWLVGSYDQGKKQTSPSETHFAFDTTLSTACSLPPQKGDTQVNRQQSGGNCLGQAGGPS